MHKGFTTIGLAVALSIALLGAFGYSKMQKSQEFVAGDTQGSLDSFKTVGNMILPRVATKDFGIGSTTATSSADFSVDATTGGVRIAGLVSCDTIDTDSNGLLACGTDGGGGGSSTFTGLDAGVTGATMVKISSLSFDAGNFNFSNTASTGFLKLDWVNGPASRAMDNAWTAVGSSSFAGSVSVAKGFTANSFQGGGLTDCTGNNALRYTSGQFSCSAVATGTVTSVALTVPTGLSVSGSPVTTSGTLAVTLTSGYEIPLTASTTGWESFYDTPSSRITAGTGLSWAGNTLNATGGGSSFSGLDFGTIGGAQVKITSQSFDAGMFDLSNTASEAFVRLDYTNGPASRSMANTWSAVNTFSVGASVSGSLEVAGTASVSTSLNVPLINGSTAANGDITINGTTSATKTTSYVILQDTGGNVGIGTATPAAKLHVVAPSAGEVIRADVGGSYISLGYNTLPYIDASTTDIRLTPNKTLSPWNDLTGSIGAVAARWGNLYAGALTISGGSGTAKAAIINNGTSTGNIFEAQDNGTAKFTISDGGNVIIGTGSTGGYLYDTGSAMVYSSLTSGSSARPVILSGQTVTFQAGATYADVAAFTNDATGPALYVNNRTNAVNIFEARDNGTAVFTVFDGGNASHSANLEIRGLASASQTFSSGLSSCTGGNFLQWNAGLFSCGTPVAGSGTFLGLDFGVIGGSQVKISSISFDAGMFDLANTASQGNVRLDWTNGPASRSANQTISGLWTFSNVGSTTFAGSIDTTLGVHSATDVSAGARILGLGLASHSFNGTIVGPSAGVLSIGTIANYLKNVVANVGRFLVTLVVPNGSAPTVAEEGSIAVDSSGFGQLVYYASGSAHTLTDEKTITVSMASTSFGATGSRSLQYLFRGMTVKRMSCQAKSATSVILNLSSNGTTDLDQLTCATTRVFDDGTIANATINKGSNLFLEWRSISGEVDYVDFTATYVPVRE